MQSILHELFFASTRAAVLTTDRKNPHPSIPSQDTLGKFVFNMLLNHPFDWPGTVVGSVPEHP
uniref:Uncharacterized protein n=1 Tax=Salix viminalis TaxID=40686 RepID=A0A6N2NIG7_SALVM